MESQASESSGDWVHLGEAIRHGRRRTGMTQEELATAAGVDRKTIGNYERGRRPSSAPRVPDGYYQVAAVLGWAPADIKRLLRGQGVDLERRVREIEQELIALEGKERTPDVVAAMDSALARLHLLEWERERRADFIAMERSSAAREPVRGGPASDDPLALFPWVSRFGQACVLHGADPELRDRLLFAAHELLAQVSTASRAGGEYGLAAYRPHGWAEGDPAVPADDADRIRKAVEEHKRNR